MILVFLLIDEDNPRKVVDLVAILPEHVVCLLALQGQDQKYGWRLHEAMLKHQVLAFLFNQLVSHLK